MMLGVYVFLGVVATLVLPGIYIGITVAIAYTVFKFLTKSR